MIFGLAALWMVLIRPQKKENGKGFMAGENSWMADLLLVFFLIIGVLLRFYDLGEVPYGLQQDEASIGYEAWSLLHYGIDRYGNPWPIYPITFGPGGGSPLLVYLTILPTMIFGTGALTVRVLPALFGCLTILLGAKLAGLGFGKRAEVIAAFLLALNPWHVIFSRWALDSNTVPFWETLFLLFLLWGVCRKSTMLLLPGAFFSGVSLYAYGSTTFVVPLFLLSFALVLLLRKSVTLPQVLSCVLVFVLTVLPIGCFYAVNYLGMEGLRLPFFSIQKLMAYRRMFYAFDASLPGKMAGNLRYLARFLTTGMEEKELASTVLFGYGQMYRFTFPLTLLGVGHAILSVCKKTRSTEEKEEGKWLLSAMLLLLTFWILLFSFFIELNVNRMILLLLPLVAFQALGMECLLEKVFAYKGLRGLLGKGLALGCALVLCAAGYLFVKDYFSPSYARQNEEYFMPGYSEAAARALELAKEREAKDGTQVTIYSTYTRLSSPFMLAAYATETPPYVLMETVTYRMANEFFVADSFGNFVFRPEQIPASPGEDILILYKDEMEEYQVEGCEKEMMGNYVVVYGASY